VDFRDGFALLGQASPETQRAGRRQNGKKMGVRLFEAGRVTLRERVYQKSRFNVKKYFEVRRKRHQRRVPRRSEHRGHREEEKITLRR